LSIQLGREYDLIIGAERLNRIDLQVDKSQQKYEVVGYFRALPGTAIHAIDVASKLSKWETVSAQERADVCFELPTFARQALENNAWMILEAGKTWVEADADTAEAIDFASSMAAKHFAMQVRSDYPLKGETMNSGIFPWSRSRNPAWNFPCAIMVGMTTAALVTGNTVY